jgi:hypothetical protein
MGPFQPRALAAGVPEIAGVRKYELRPPSRYTVRGFFSLLALRQPVAVHLLWHAAAGEGSHMLVELAFSRPIDPEVALLIARQQGVFAWLPAGPEEPLIALLRHEDGAAAKFANLVIGALKCDPAVTVRQQAVDMERVDWRGYDLYVAQTDWGDEGGPFPVSAVVVPLPPERQKEVAASRAAFDSALTRAAWVVWGDRDPADVDDDDLTELHFRLLQVEFDYWAPTVPEGSKKLQQYGQMLGSGPILYLDVWEVVEDGVAKRVLTIGSDECRLPAHMIDLGVGKGARGVPN